jgi:S-adenosylmethionine/arginine decarboxylase-like enzyme
MAVSSLQNKNLPTQAKLLKVFKSTYPNVGFKAGSEFTWSPKSATITYVIDESKDPIHTYALLHEIAHADLHHNTFNDDFDLLQLEVAAWERARAIGISVNIAIDEEHMQDCLDTYRDWLHARAQCPACGVVSLQAKDGSYTCFNCKTGWKVPKSQLCRVRRTRI